ncbi:hypothetical protein EEL32_20535 [Brevibacillus laterosporus]|nr:glycoside hydrolase [Brevibacillus laterosporus]TPG68001.1 hypothetical protein EEL31_05125 [Brevibacillus laterosporus]TPG81286.1 hypothetical protein EEL32_20535 [Brevibacillus laterosporus]
MKKQTYLMFPLFASLLVTGCGPVASGNVSGTTPQSIQAIAAYKSFSFDVDPETFEVWVIKDGVKERVSEPIAKQKVTDLTKTADAVSWTYPDQHVKVELTKGKTDLHVTIISTAQDANHFTWPTVQADSYMVPIGEGKYIPSKDNNWKSFLKEKELSFTQDFSMRFFASNKQKYTIMYVADHMFNSDISFMVEPQIRFSFTHSFPRIHSKKEFGFRIFVTDNDPVSIASIYKKQISDEGGNVTLAEKAKSNSNIEKLYGAPHIYLWDKSFISDSNIKWPQLKNTMKADTFAWIKNLASTKLEMGKEAVAELEKVRNQEYADKYQKRVITQMFNELLKLREFYNPTVFKTLNDPAKAFVAKGVNQLKERDLYELNKQLLKSVLGQAADEVNKWAVDKNSDLLADMHKAGIQKAWIGLPDWSSAYINPDMVKEANELGYLIGPYDSYHSIHEKEDKEWRTAYFADNQNLYDNATITNQNGKKIGGFLQRGRKLNPTLSLPSVEQRLKEIMSNEVVFNSWFIDCDATGEIFDDYTPGHETTQEQDVKARMDRMAYIRDQHKMVIGSEGGNDLASKTIAYAHGIETPVIAWGDKDMNDKTSKYYIGAYYSPDGGVAPRQGKAVPIKELYKHIYLDPAYTLPFYKLVYNNSVITTHHWEWGSLKVQDEAHNRMMYEILYNVPPLYHLDKNKWAEDKAVITKHLAVWTPFHEKAVTREMTDYKILSQDRQVQMTAYGDDLKVIANFSKQDFTYEGKFVKASSLIILDADKEIVYQ